MRRFLMAVKHGDVDVGFETRKTWKDKPYFAFYHEYYNGDLYAIHIGPFYFCCTY